MAAHAILAAVSATLVLVFSAGSQKDPGTDCHGAVVSCDSVHTHALALETTAVPQKACFQCGGRGKVHRSSMPHNAGCIFCTTCVGCKGTGAIPDNASQCPKCTGQGRYHDSPMPHSGDCIFCTSCNTCKAKGWIK